MGSGVRTHEDLAAPLGRRLARLGVHLLTGGGRGVMESVARAFASVEDREGLVIGVLPLEEEVPEAGESGTGAASKSAGGPASGYPNPWVEIAVRTHLGKNGMDPGSRNHVNVLTSDVVVALPGSSGTASEVALSVRYGRPVILYGDLERARSLPPVVATADTVDEVIAFVKQRLPDSRAGSGLGGGGPAPAPP